MDQHTVLVADAHIAIRTGIRHVLQNHEFIVLDDAATADEAIRCAVTHRPDACLLAVDLPGNGVSAARRIKQRVPETRVLMMNGVHRDEDLLACLRAGADGYLLKSTSAERLPDAVLGMLAGEAVFSRQHGHRLVEEFRDGREQRYLVSIPGGMVELTAREYEVLGHLRERRSTASVAAHLGISETTVRRHISAMLGQLGVSNRRHMMELLGDR